MDDLYSPLFDALCHRCCQLLWGPVGAHKFLVSRDDSAVRTTNLFGVATTDVITSAIFEFRNDLFANYVQYKEPPFRVPPRLHPTSIGPFKVFDTPVSHSPHRMYACLVCSKYRAKYDPINYGYEVDGTTHYRVPSKLANLTEYQKRQIALGALYSNTLKHVDLRHRQWLHAIGTVGVGRKPSQHYNALYGFMTMKEDVLRDYQKPKDSAQDTRQMNQALLLLKKVHSFYSRFLAHYETLYRYLQNAASTMGTLTQRFLRISTENAWSTIYKTSMWLRQWSVMHRGTLFPILPLTKTEWDSCIEHHFNVQGGPSPLQHNHWRTTRICISSIPNWNRAFGRIRILVELVDTRLNVELDVQRITVAGILHLMSARAVTDGGPSSK